MVGNNVRIQEGNKQVQEGNRQPIAVGPSGQEGWGSTRVIRVWGATALQAEFGCRVAG